MHNIKRILVSMIRMSGLTLLLAGSAHSQTSNLTYQGYLRDGGLPANGTFNMVFRLFAVQAGGTALQIFPSAGTTAVAVVNGLFTQELTFNTAHFDGSNRWLEIVANGTTLTPRVKLNAAPYSILAATVPDNSITASKLANDAASLNKVSGGALSSNGTFVGLGTATPVGASRFVIAQNTTSYTGMYVQTTAASAGLPFYGYSNSGGTAWHYLDGSDDNKWKLQTGGIARLTVTTAGSVGIGTTAPTATLDVVGTVKMTGLQLGTSATAGHVLTANASGVGTWQALPAGATVWQVNGSDLSNTNTGNVSIGTTSPERKLTIAGGLVIDKNNQNGTSNNFGITFGAFSGEGIASNRSGAGANQNGLDFYAGTGNTPKMSITNAGRVGIGTTAPTALFEVRGGSTPTSFTASPGTLFGANNSTAVTLDTPGTGTIGVWDNFVVNNNFGVGTSNPGAQVEFAMSDKRLQFRFDGAVPGINLTGTGGNLGIMRLRNAMEIWPSDGGASAGYLDIRNTSGTPQIVFNGSNGNAYMMGSVGIGTSSPDAKLRVIGTIKTDVLEISGAGDLAERFEILEEVQPGMVVEIDPATPGRLRLARKAYSPLVAGVISGANELRAGVILDPNSDGKSHPIALTGRVWVYCDATQKAIVPGTLLTSSNTPGYAMAVTDHARAKGAVLGKAMSALPKGKKGMVLVLVGLQ